MPINNLLEIMSRLRDPLMDAHGTLSKHLRL